MGRGDGGGGRGKGVAAWRWSARLWAQGGVRAAESIWVAGMGDDCAFWVCLLK